MPANCYTKALREPIFFLWETQAGPKAKVAKYRSLAAVGLKHGKGELVYDHAVPFRYLQAELLQLEPVTPASVRGVLDRFGTAVLLTKHENTLFNSKGLGHRMPDPLARYKASDIELVTNDRNALPMTLRVPHPATRWRDVSLFALTYNGYDRHGQATADIGNNLLST